MSQMCLCMFIDSYRKQHNYCIAPNFRGTIFDHYQYTQQRWTQPGVPQITMFIDSYSKHHNIAMYHVCDKKKSEAKLFVHISL